MNSDIQNDIIDAIKNGNLDDIKKLYMEYKSVIEDLDPIQYCECLYGGDACFMDMALHYGCGNVVKWLHQNGHKPLKCGMIATIRENNRKMIRLLQKLGYKYSPDIIFKSDNDQTCSEKTFKLLFSALDINDMNKLIDSDMTRWTTKLEDVAYTIRYNVVLNGKKIYRRNQGYDKMIEDEKEFISKLRTFEKDMNDKYGYLYDNNLELNPVRTSVLDLMRLNRTTKLD